MSARYMLKAAVVGVLMLVLLVPLGLINATINERAAYRQQAVAAVAESYAGPQVLAGPVLVIPYVETRREQGVDAFGKPVETLHRESKHWLFFPASSAVEGRVVPAVRKRGLHGKFRLVKGASADNAPRIVESFPDVRKRTDRKSGAAGDVPVLIVNTTILKDAVMANIWRDSRGS